MKTLCNIWIIICLVLINFNTAIAEGTKQFRPTSADYGNLQINDKQRPFAQETNTDPLHRLYFHISSIQEKVYFGFNHQGAGTATFRIKDPSGVVVYARTPIPTATPTPGFINTYAEAVIGPRIGRVPVGGYNPLQFTPATTGDFYIEFTTSLVDAYHFDLFDLTVVNATNVPIPGRLWSYAWDLNTRSYANRFYGKFYVYTDDGYVSELGMNGIQPYGFVISCNSTGTGNVLGGNNDNRKSVVGNSIRPQYKLFLNDPDPTVYPAGPIPMIIQNLQLVGTAYYFQPVRFSLDVSRAGVVEMIIDLNGIPGYQTGTEDIILVEPVVAGPDTIVWDGKNGLGNFVEPGTRVALITSSFSAGITHFPLFDPETHLSGFVVNKIRPVSGLAKLYWDDSNFSGGTVNVDGSLTDGHSWQTNFGDERTMNTWWDGYKLDVLNNFTIEFVLASLPVDLLLFTGKKILEGIELIWSTATETNAWKYEIYRTTDMINYVLVGEVAAAGNSNMLQEYSFVDTSLLTGIIYYLLKQIDFDGKTQEYTTVVTNVMNTFEELFSIAVLDDAINIRCHTDEEMLVEISLYSIAGQIIQMRKQVVSNIESICLAKQGIAKTQNYIIVLKTLSGHYSKRIVL